jgi:hypothetical protein
MFNVLSTPRVTTPCLAAFQYRMADIHESAQRLTDALSAFDPSAEVNPTYVARVLNESPQTVTNWRNRGVSEAGAINAQRLFGVSCTWILDGLEPMLVSQSQPARLTPEIIAEGWELAKLIAAQTAGGSSLQMPRDAALFAQAANAVIERNAERDIPSPKFDIGDGRNGKRTGKTGGSGKPSGKDVAGAESAPAGGRRRQSSS